MRFTLFVSLVAALMAIPCLVLREVKPPLHPLPAGCHLRALLGLVSGVFIAMKSANKLTPDGRLAAILVGTILFAASSVFFFAIIAFFISSMYWSKFKRDQKREFDPDHHSGNTKRNAINVICNGGVACAYSLLYLAVQESKTFILSPPRGIDASWFFLAITGTIVCSTADTWSSEIGSVLRLSMKKRAKQAKAGSDDKKDVKKEKLPMCRLIIPPFKRVPRGTNGGVSLVGFIAAALAGAWIALCVLIALWWTNGIVLSEDDGKLTAKVLFLSLAITGLFGSAIDSVLGALFQFSGKDLDTRLIVSEPGDGVIHISGQDILDNHAVNILSATAAALFGPLCFQLLHNRLALTAESQ